MEEESKQAKEKFGDINDIIPKNDPPVLHQTQEGATIIFTPEDFVKANVAN